MLSQLKILFEMQNNINRMLNARVRLKMREIKAKHILNNKRKCMLHENKKNIGVKYPKSTSCDDVVPFNVS